MSISVSPFPPNILKEFAKNAIRIRRSKRVQDRTDRLEKAFAKSLADAHDARCRLLWLNRVPVRDPADDADDAALADDADDADNASLADDAALANDLGLVRVPFDDTPSDDRPSRLASAYAFLQSEEPSERCDSMSWMDDAIA